MRRALFRWANCCPTLRPFDAETPLNASGATASSMYRLIRLLIRQVSSTCSSIAPPALTAGLHYRAPEETMRDLLGDPIPRVKIRKDYLPKGELPIEEIDRELAGHWVLL